MHWSRKYVIVGGSVLALAAGGAGAAVAIGSGDDEGGATGPGADQAKAAALELYPDGHANAVERDSEDGGTWEVEVRKADGSTVDVRLDQNYQLVVAETDSEDQGGN
ncbi:MAG TPA: PepSY domain-containing protein [Solirubrobacterales bacterium]|nr:PepSY domain-containing protein [Solirubrobacterales bacterium]